MVKVQRSNILPVINLDLAILAELASGAQYTPLGQIYDLPAIVDQFAATMRAELTTGVRAGTPIASAAFRRREDRLRASCPLGPQHAPVSS